MVRGRTSASTAVAGLRIPRSMLAAVVAHLEAAQPNEGVGLIAVVPEQSLDRAVAFYPGTNLDQSPTRYTMDPAEVIAAVRAMDANGWTLGAIVHSHPRSAPTPSATDLREAYYPDALLLIVGFATGVAEAKLWQLAPGRAGRSPREVQLVINDD
jgi:proteasome lid subunit RPN8/RPN11